MCKGKGKGKGKSSNQSYKDDELNVKSKEAMKEADMIRLESEQFLMEASDNETEEVNSDLDMDQFLSEEGKRETENEKEKKKTEFDKSQLTDLPILAPEMEAIINNSLNSSEETVLIDAYRIPIRPSDVKTLLNGKWLNDNIINFYMQMIVARWEEDRENFRSVYALSSFFYPKLMQGGYDSIKRWIKDVDIFSHSLILIPVHVERDHWCLATIDMEAKLIVYYDSLGGKNNPALRLIDSFLQQEHLTKRGSALGINYEKMNAKNIPQQKNGSDCGMFVCKFAEYLSRKAEFTFSQSNMPYFRKRMMYEITRNELLYPSKVPIRIKSPSPAKSPNHSNFTDRYGCVSHSWSEEQAKAHGYKGVMNSWPWYCTDRSEQFDRKPFFLAACHEPEKVIKYLRQEISETQARIERMKAKQEKETININISSLTWRLQMLQEEEKWLIR